MVHNSECNKQSIVVTCKPLHVNMNVFEMEDYCWLLIKFAREKHMSI